jgi:ferrous iron transport protein B
MVDAFKKSNLDDTFGGDFEALVADGRYKYITKYFSPTLKRKNKDKFIVTPSDKADKVLTHKIWGIPIFLLILLASFHLTFSENLFFLGGLLPEGYVTLEGTIFEGVFGEGGINSPGVSLMNLLGLLTDTLTGVVAGWLSSAEPWVSGLICDGILGGVFAVLGFLPQILVLFMFFSILEDSGYMARIAFILDRALRKFGLSGRAFLPMIMGFGCSVPAMINTRTLADEKEKLATIRVIPFFSCGAKLPILTAVAGAIITKGNLTGGYADFITYGMYLVGIITALIAVILMRKTTQKGEVPPFIMELPSYHAPQFKNLMVLLWEKAKHFVEKAFTIILASTIIIWVASHFDFNWKFLSDEQMSSSILAGLSGLIQPLFTPLGFGSQLSIHGWVFALAAITGLIAKENVVATLGSLAVGLNFAGVDGLFLATGITIPALLAFIAFNMTTIPCFAAVSAAKGEIPDKKKFNWTLLFWIATSFIVSSAIYFIGTWWWTSFIFVGAFVAVCLIIRAVNKRKDLRV